MFLQPEFQKPLASVTNAIVKDPVNFVFTNLSKEKLPNNFLKVHYDQDTNQMVITYRNSPRSKGYNYDSLYIINFLKNLHGAYGNEELQRTLYELTDHVPIDVYKIASIHETWNPVTRKIEIDDAHTTSDPFTFYTVCLLISITSAHTLEYQDVEGIIEFLKFKWMQIAHPLLHLEINFPEEG